LLNKITLKRKFKFIDLFAGIGGFHLAFHELGGKCVFACDNDEKARNTYEENFKDLSPNLFRNGTFARDIEQVPEDRIPSFDLLCAGFPCQPFSQAGFRKGFADQGRGNLFFEIARIIEKSRPSAYFLENVRGIMHHDEGRTFSAIKRVLTEELGYSFSAQIVKASDFNLPQHRPRTFMVGFDTKKYGQKAESFEFPEPVPLTKTMSDIWNAPCDREVGFTLRCGGRHSGIDNRWNWDAYRVNGKVKILSPNEGKRMMGFPESFSFPVSDGDAMKQLGNSVAVSAIRAVGSAMLRHSRKQTVRKSNKADKA
jgi:DNA (cytosine-5)-methyltransferase 1